MPGILYVPVDLPAPVALTAGGKPFWLGSAPRLLLQSAWLLRLLGDDVYDLAAAIERFGARLDEPCEGFPQDLPRSEFGSTVGAAGAGSLYWAALNAVELKASIYVH